MSFEEYRNELIDVCKNAIEKWGSDAQLLQVVKECIELADVVFRYIDGKSINLDVIEELVDVETMITQLELIMGSGIIIRRERRVNLNNLRWKIENEE